VQDSRGSCQFSIEIMRASIKSLIADFPYAYFSDEEIVELFSKCGFSLGLNDNIRIKVVQHFRTLSKQ
jgi:hypothetical protein